MAHLITACCAGLPLPAAQLKAQFGSGYETEAQLKAQAATQFGSGNETAAQLKSRYGGPKGWAAGGRARLKQANLRRWSGRVIHKKCGQVVVIDKAAEMARGNAVSKRCPHCKKTGTFSTQDLAVDLVDSDSE